VENAEDEKTKDLCAHNRLRLSCSRCGGVRRLKREFNCEFNYEFNREQYKREFKRELKCRYKREQFKHGFILGLFSDQSLSSLLSGYEEQGRQGLDGSYQ